MSSTEAGTVHYKLDNGRWRIGTLHFNVKVAKGKHTVRAYIVDAADNASTTVTVRWKVVAT